MRTNQKKLINGMLVLLCILSAQMVGPRLLLATITSLTATPTSVPADGFSYATITAIVDNGQASGASQTLQFTNPSPGVFQTGPGQPISATTDSSGKATVLLISTLSTGIASVTCTQLTGVVGVPLNVAVRFSELPQPTPTPTPQPAPYLKKFILSVVNPSAPVGDPKVIPAITAQLFDQYNKALAWPDVKVVFTTTPAGLAYFSNKLTTITVSTDATGAATAFLFSKTFGTATVSAVIEDGFTDITTSPVFVEFTGVGPPAFISLSANPYRIPADGSSTLITAFVADSRMQPVAAGTVVRFSTTLGVFQNGQQTYSVATPDATGVVTVRLGALISNATGFAVITVTSGSASQSITVQFARLELETEPNDTIASADEICFGDVYLAQLKSPYEEDWYTFTITEPSRIGINFITTASPADAGCDSGTTTVGTWKMDIRNLDNEILMSYHNIDCIFDNGIWETGVIPPGTYYIVVYCPRLGSGDIYLSDKYYMSVFNDFYFPCGDGDVLGNSASLSQEASTYQLHLPIIDTTPYIRADLLYDPIPGTSLMFRLTDSGVPENLDGYKSCNLSNLYLVDGNYVLHVPAVIFAEVSYRIDLTYVPTSDGQIWFMLSGIWLN